MEVVDSRSRKMSGYLGSRGTVGQQLAEPPSRQMDHNGKRDTFDAAADTRPTAILTLSNTVCHGRSLSAQKLPLWTETGPRGETRWFRDQFTNVRGKSGRSSPDSWTFINERVAARSWTCDPALRLFFFWERPTTGDYRANDCISKGSSPGKCPCPTTILALKIFAINRPMCDSWTF